MLGTRAFVTVCIGLVFVSSISLKRASFVLGSKGVITVLGLCLDCGIQFLSSYSARNQVPQGSLPITRSRTTFLVALDLQ